MHYDPNLPNCILKKNNRLTLKLSGLQKVVITNTNSNIIRNNNNILWCCCFFGLEGLFRKDKNDTFAYGRRVCDNVKETFNNEGFFTSDELPRYGITRSNTREIFQQMDKEKNDGTLIAIFAYNEETSRKILRYLINHLSNEVQNLTGTYPRVSKK
jgi:Glu-tRNA(Gln) amidotransferase subunit E-like FAD-binding protein